MVIVNRRGVPTLMHKLATVVVPTPRLNPNIAEFCRQWVADLKAALRLRRRCRGARDGAQLGR